VYACGGQSPRSELDGCSTRGREVVSKPQLGAVHGNGGLGALASDGSSPATFVRDPGATIGRPSRNDERGAGKGPV
jgi:hypothetical protein